MSEQRTWEIRPCETSPHYVAIWERDGGEVVCIIPQCQREWAEDVCRAVNGRAHAQRAVQAVERICKSRELRLHTGIVTGRWYWRILPGNAMSPDYPDPVSAILAAAEWLEREEGR